MEFFAISPIEQSDHRSSEGCFQHCGFAVAQGESDFPQRFIRRVLAGNAEEVRGAVGVILVGKIEGAVRPFRLVEELRLRQAALKRGEHGAEIG